MQSSLIWSPCELLLTSIALHQPLCTLQKCSNRPAKRPRKQRSKGLRPQVLSEVINGLRIQFFDRNTTQLQCSSENLKIFSTYSTAVFLRAVSLNEEKVLILRKKGQIQQLETVMQAKYQYPTFPQGSKLRGKRILHKHETTLEIKRHVAEKCSVNF